MNEWFPNLAGVEDCDAIVRAELDAAGIEIHSMEFLRKHNGEVPTAIVGSLWKWGFRRAWRYWVAEGPGLPPADAERLHAVVGTECRVAGHCAAPSPLEWYQGFAVGLYHVDSQVGLNALADALRAVLAGCGRLPSEGHTSARLDRQEHEPSALHDEAQERISTLLDMTKVIAREGFDCPDCGHRHTGMS